MFYRNESDFTLRGRPGGTRGNTAPFRGETEPQTIDHGRRSISMTISSIVDVSMSAATVQITAASGKGRYV
jgi:hypothetical protein